MFSVKDFFSKCHQICSFTRILSNLPKKSLMDNLMFVYSNWSSFNVSLNQFISILRFDYGKNALQNFGYEWINLWSLQHGFYYLIKHFTILRLTILDFYLRTLIYVCVSMCMCCNCVYICYVYWSIVCAFICISMKGSMGKLVFWSRLEVKLCERNGCLRHCSTILRYP